MMNHKEEYEKCKRDPRYFHNNYVKYDGHKELSEKEWEEYVDKVTIYRSMSKFKARKGGYLRIIGRYDYPMLPEDVFKTKKL